MDGPVEFYDRIAPFYHLVYADWEASVLRQGEQLDDVLRELIGTGPKSILDAACGIGTQSLGLAGRGHAVTASDISTEAVARAKREAARLDLQIEFGLVDLRHLSERHAGPFDAVIACDNALPHLLSVEELLAAFRQMYRCTRPGGAAVISVRDYDPAESTGTKVVPFGQRTEGDRRYLVFQVWEFRGELYDLAMYFVEDRGGTDCTTHVMRCTYFAIPVARLVELMLGAGFRDVRRLDGRFFQPLIVGTRPQSP